MLKVIPALVIAVTFSTQAHALNLMSTFQKMAHKKMESTQTHLVKIQKGGDNQCEQFQGEWKGTCTENGKTEEDTFFIEQNACTSISLGTTPSEAQEYDLTGVGINSGSNAGIFNSQSQNMAAQWSPDRKTIRIVGNTLMNSPLISKPLTFTASGQITMDGGQLVTTLHSSGDDSGDVNCRYSKVK